MIDDTAKLRRSITDHLPHGRRTEAVTRFMTDIFAVAFSYQGARRVEIIVNRASCPSTFSPPGMVDLGPGS
jgi:hypothetical protein